MEVFLESQFQACSAKNKKIERKKIGCNLQAYMLVSIPDK
jgi:hypothetical protein